MSNQTFYTQGSVALLDARKRIFEVSQIEASKRLSFERSLMKTEVNDESLSYWESPDIVSFSQIGDKRPLSAVSLCDYDSLVAVSGFSGDINIFQSNDRDLARVYSLRSHNDRCTTVAWSSGESRVSLASGGADRTICLWALDSASTGEERVIAPANVMKGHELRINRIAFHPKIDNLLVSTSDDETWRLWDIETREELLLQEGHIAPVFGLSIHPDGSLVSTSDTAGVVRIWDLRTGRSILGFDGQHVEQVIGLDFSPNGINLASCSGDNTIRIWDIRNKKNAEILSAHEKLVSSVKYSGNGALLMSAGYDSVARIWRTSDYKILKNLPIHESRIMAADFSKDGMSVVSACYDRTFKIWRRHGENTRMKMEESEI
jgi:U4/U6 small nuclear ribonucleoprotein PRP4